jgi:hypothetical protein
MHIAVLLSTSLRYQGYSSRITEGGNKDKATEKATPSDPYYSSLIAKSNMGQREYKF